MNKYSQTWYLVVRRQSYLVFVLLFFNAFDLRDDVGDLFASSEAFVQLREGVIVASHVRKDGLLVRSERSDRNVV